LRLSTRECGFPRINIPNSCHTWNYFVLLLRKHTHAFNSPLSGTTQVSQYQKGKTNLDFTEARDSEWQWHQLGHMQICTSLQTNNHASTPPLKFFLQAGCPSCCPTNKCQSIKEFAFFAFKENELKSKNHCIYTMYICTSLVTSS